jgi:hypothetical protein
MLVTVGTATKGGFPVRDEDTERLSPFTYDHINMLGRYSFAMPDIVARGGSIASAIARIELHHS